MELKYSCSMTNEAISSLLRQQQFRAASIIAKSDLFDSDLYGPQSQRPRLDPIWDFVTDGIKRECSVSSNPEEDVKIKLIVLFSILYPKELENCSDDKVLQKDFYNYYLENAALSYFTSSTAATLLEPLKLSRIDIKNVGNESNTVEVESCNDNKFSALTPKFLSDNKGKGVSFTSSADDISVLLKCKNDGELLLQFRTLDLRDTSKNRINFFIDYKNIEVFDGQSNLLSSADGYSTTHHNHPKEFKLKVQDSDKVQITFSRKFNFDTYTFIPRLADALFDVDLNQFFS